MRLRSTTVLGLTALTVLTLPGCSHSPTTSTGTNSSQEAAQPTQGTGGTKPTTPLSSATLRERLLETTDLGTGYTRTPEHASGHDDVTVIDCPALAKLGGDAATGGSLDFPRRAKASFTYAGGSDAQLAEELYSDTAAKLSQGVGRIFDAMASCPAYQVVVGSTPIEVTTEKAAAPQLGDEQWSQLLTFTVAGRSSVVKQTAIRRGTLVVVVSGSPASSSLLERRVEAD
ncbi:hypothetical protein OG607_41720 [Streptomyces sp. NBC_01537]|uniref:hypothetical protein n=1 Tax=Streptomyces sp. NBC_01537 TaxID=2903896 RepID=UPI00386D76A9